MSGPQIERITLVCMCIAVVAWMIWNWDIIF